MKRVTTTVITVFILFFTGCKTTKVLSDEVGAFQVVDIKKLEDNYLIYIDHSDTVYKVVSQINQKRPVDCQKIKKGMRLNLNLKAIDPYPTVDGVSMAPINYLDVHCFNFGRDSICIEPKKGYDRLYRSPELFGDRYCAQ
jgi:hypothetical protein